jgi:hypothetical protein
MGRTQVIDIIEVFNMSRKFGKQNMPSDPKELLYRKFIRDEATGCWNWNGALRADGYGAYASVALLGRRGVIPASRASWMIHNGQPPVGLLVCHTCDNRLCVNPDHLFLGTPKQNSEDMVAKRRMYGGERHWKAKLTREDAEQVRSLRASGWKIKPIAEKFGVTTSAIDGVLSGVNWRPCA